VYSRALKTRTNPWTGLDDGIKGPKRPPKWQTADNFRRIREEMIEMVGPEDSDAWNGRWFFWSGITEESAVDRALNNAMEPYYSQPSKAVPKALPFVLDTPGLQSLKKEAEDDNARSTWFSYASSQFAGLVKGRVCIVIPDEVHVDDPYNGLRNSNWWSYEFPQLSRKNGGVVDIVRLNLNGEDRGTIWQRSKGVGLEGFVNPERDLTPATLSKLSTSKGN